MTVIESDIISIIAVLVSCFLATFIIGAIATLAWLKSERDWHKSNSVNPDELPPTPPAKDGDK